MSNWYDDKAKGGYIYGPLEVPKERTETELERLLGVVLHDIKERCDYCGCSPSDNIVEHKTPRSRGGDDRPANLGLACRSCNAIKGPMTLEEFRAELVRRFKHEVIFYFEMPSTPWAHLVAVRLSKENAELRGIITRVSRVTYAGEAYKIEREDEDRMEELVKQWRKESGR